MVIALAVGTLLAALGLVTAAANASRASWADHGEDVNIDRAWAAARSTPAPRP